VFFRHYALVIGNNIISIMSLAFGHRAWAKVERVSRYRICVDGHHSVIREEEVLA
jgi:purine-cytosine permease-like protein